MEIFKTSEFNEEQVHLVSGSSGDQIKFRPTPVFPNPSRDCSAKLTHPDNCAQSQKIRSGSSNLERSEHSRQSGRQLFTKKSSLASFRSVKENISGIANQKSKFLEGISDSKTPKKNLKDNLIEIDSNSKTKLLGPNNLTIKSEIIPSHVSSVNK